MNETKLKNLERVAKYRGAAIRYQRELIIKKENENQDLRNQLAVNDRLIERLKELFDFNANNTSFFLALKFLWKIILAKFKKNKL